MHNRETSYDLLDAFLAGGIEQGAVVLWCWCLIVLPICDRVWSIGAVLWLCWCWVCVLDKLLSDILGHVNIHVPLCIIPIKGDATVEVAFPIFNNVVGFCSEGSNEMFETTITNIFDAKVIEAKIEPNGA
jgi:hypothetical protein